MAAAIGLGGAPGTGWAATAGGGLAAARAAAGLPGLADNAGLDAAATRHALEMATAGQLLHSQLGTLTAGVIDPLTAGVIDHPQRVAENVGVGASADEVLTAFLASPEHRGNLLGDFDVVGTGVAVGTDGRVWVTEVFVKLPPVAVAAAPITASTAVAPVVTTAAPKAPVRTSTRHHRARRHRRIAGARVQ